VSSVQYGWRSSTLSHVGNVRQLNEDSCLDRSSIGLWVVADGMGGHAAGDLASQMIVNALSCVPAPTSLSRFVEDVEASLISVNSKLLKLAREKNQTTGSTVVAMLAHGRHCVLIWAGDSRAYRLRDGELAQMSTDHSQVELYIEQGLMTREEARGHPASNMVTRAVGASEEILLDMEVVELAPGDRYLLCSDGLDKHLSDIEIAGVLAAGDVDTAAAALIERTLERGANDNVTVSVIDILAEPLSESEDDPDETVPVRRPVTASPASASGVRRAR